MTIFCDNWFLIRSSCYFKIVIDWSMTTFCDNRFPIRSREALKLSMTLFCDNRFLLRAMGGFKIVIDRSMTLFKWLLQNCHWPVNDTFQMTASKLSLTSQWQFQMTPSKLSLTVQWQFSATRPKPAYGRQGLDWIVGPGYSLGRVHSGGKPWKTNLEPWKTMETNQKP